MQAVAASLSNPTISLGQRRGIPDVARWALDPTWARVDSRGDYPSPPMSGSPPPPNKASQEAHRSDPVVYPATTTAARNAPQAIPATPITRGSERLPPGLSPLASTSGPPMAAGAYAFERAKNPVPRPFPPPSRPPHQHGHYLPQQGYLSGPAHAIGPPQTSPVYTSHGYVPSPLQVQQGLLQASPKSQRKTKGHVASACVPCKRAHLRCDAQRPCTRCLSNGKADACIDVQHKKRGRPRLRDDRDPRFEVARFSTAPEAAMRRPMSLYELASSVAAPFDDSLRRGNSYRVLKSQPSEPTIAPRFLERGATSDANMYLPPRSVSTRAPEPAMYLTMELEVAKASSTFLDAIGRLSAHGLRLTDLVVPGQRDRVAGFRAQMQAEQSRKDPNYLPPILVEQERERVMQGLGFSHEELARYSLERFELLSLMSQDGQPRQVPVRMGLGKQDSIYFIVVALSVAVGSLQHLTPSPSRLVTYAYHHPVPPPYSQPTPSAATFERRQPQLRRGDGRSTYRAQPNAPPQLMTAGLGPSVSSYSASPSRTDYQGPSSYQIPRSERPPTTFAPQAPSLQLPPIRSPQPPGPPTLPPPPPQESTYSASRYGRHQYRVSVPDAFMDRPRPTAKPPSPQP